MEQPGAVGVALTRAVSGLAALAGSTDSAAVLVEAAEQVVRGLPGARTGFVVPVARPADDPAGAPATSAVPRPWPRRVPWRDEVQPLVDAEPTFATEVVDGDGVVRRVLGSRIRYEGLAWGALLLVLDEVTGAATRDEAHQDRLGVVATIVANGLARLDTGSVLRRLAFTDALTGIGNRRAIDEALQERAAAGDDVVLLILDVDRFKQVNDTHGHDFGDTLLRSVAASLSALAARLPRTVVGRLGGDEFAVVTDAQDVEQVVECVREVGEALTAASPEAGISSGWARRSTHLPPATPAEFVPKGLLRVADAGLYADKQRRSRGRVGGEPAQWPASSYALLRELTDTLLLASDAPPLTRLELVADGVCALVSGASWGISCSRAPSSVPGEEAQIVDLATGMNTSMPRRGALRSSALSSYGAADYPATVRAFDGELLYAGITQGESSERRLLATTDFDTVVGLGTRDAAGTGWLLEVYGDALTPDLRPLMPLLQVLVQLAVEGGAPAPG